MKKQGIFGGDKKGKYNMLCFQRVDRLEELKQLQKENEHLKEELRIAISDRKDAETAIANYFINHWRTRA